MTRRLLTILVVALLVLAGGFTLLQTKGDGDRTLVATFSRTTSLYAGAQVKVLGVKVGTVDSIKVKGTSVEVRISYDSDVKLPADVHALIVPPSIVGDRFVQLAPAYDEGAVLADDAHLGLDRTGVPVELDDTYQALDEFAAGLGPDGANKNGALSRLVTATAKNLSGHGKAFNEAIREFAGAISTLAGSSGDIDSTIDNLAALTSTLAGKDDQLRSLVENLASVGTELNGQRDEISTSIADLQQALGEVAAFARKNRTAIRSTIDGLTDVSGVLSHNTKALGDLLSLAPIGLTNLANIYIPKNWDPSKPWLSTVDGRAGSANLRGALFDDLDSQLGFSLSTICASLPAEQQVKIASFCSTLQSLGGNLGALLSQAAEQGATAFSPHATSLDGLMGGAR